MSSRCIIYVTVDAFGKDTFEKNRSNCCILTDSKVGLENMNRVSGLSGRVRVSAPERLERLCLESFTWLAYSRILTDWSTVPFHWTSNVMSDS